MTTDIHHQPVLLNEVLEYLNPQPSAWYLDGTLGAAGHTIAILKKNAKVIAFDSDQEAITRAKENIEAACPGIKLSLYENQPIDSSQTDCILINENFSKLNEVLPLLGNIKLSGALLDLGTSTYQLLDPNRGFSFQYDAPLDMRMDKRLGVTAADLVNALPEKHLVKLFEEYADEPQAKKIAKAIAERRSILPFQKTSHLADLVARIKPRGSTHPATQVFQALRIAVNLERESIENALPQIVEALDNDANLVVISFHSGEDRIIKNFFKDHQSLGILTKNPLTPTQEELNKNPRSRSAKLRVAKKNDQQNQEHTHQSQNYRNGSTGSSGI